MKTKILFALLYISLINMIYAEPMDKEIQLSKDLKIIELSNDLFVIEHSYPWPANSLIINLNENHILLIDTPYSTSATEIALNWIKDKFKNKKITAINTGFHIDNLGGNQVLLNENINIYGSDKSIELINSRGQESKDLFISWLQKPKLKEYREYYEQFDYINPNRVFDINDGDIFYLDNDKVEIYFPGETHSPDNVVVYIEKFRILFGGCMILTKDKTGNVADANISKWPISLEKLNKYEIEILIPGHGLVFSQELIQKTINTLKN